MMYSTFIQLDGIVIVIKYVIVAAQSSNSMAMVRWSMGSGHSTVQLTFYTVDRLMYNNILLPQCSYNIDHIRW